MSDHGTPTPRNNQPPTRKPGDRPPPPPIVAYEDVTASCGHTEKFGLFADKQDRFRNDRRKKVLERPCKACREAKQREEQEAAQAPALVGNKYAVAKHE